MKSVLVISSFLIVASAASAAILPSAGGDPGGGIVSESLKVTSDSSAASMIGCVLPGKPVVKCHYKPKRCLGCMMIRRLKKFGI